MSTKYLEQGSGRIAYDEHGITNTRLRIIQRNKVFVGLRCIAFHHQRLDDQQPAVLVMRVTDGGDNRPNDFT